MKVQLSGMPELRLGLNDKVLLEATGRGTDADLTKGKHNRKRKGAKEEDWEEQEMGGRMKR